jgi:hypothetical protein
MSTQVPKNKAVWIRPAVGGSRCRWGADPSDVLKAHIGRNFPPGDGYTWDESGCQRLAVGRIYQDSHDLA